MNMELLLIVPIIAIAYAIPKWKKAKKIREIEENLPEALLQVSTLTEITSFERLIEKMAEGQNQLSQEFKKVNRQIKNGIPVKESLQSLEQESPLLSRTAKLLKQSYRTGANMSKALRETAEDITQTQEILRERSSSTMIEKYTLLLAGGCIVPLILGVLVALINNIGFIDIGMGMNIQTRQAIVNNASLANQIYLAEYALLASVFVSLQETKPEKALIYACVLIPLSLILFHLASTSIAF
ncbi:type II secretion system F family protein [archaeon]|nr:type II secretion system F family protein [archaeon]